VNIRTLIRIVGLALAASTLLAACEGGASTPTGNPLISTITPQPEVVATVNGQTITRDLLDREMARWNAGRASLGQSELDAAGKQKVLDLLIEQELIRQTASAQGVTVSDDEVTAAINLMIQDTGQEAFDGWLTSNFYSPEEFRGALRTELVSNKMTGPIADSVPLTVDHIHARHILVNTEAEANEVFARLQAGEDFAALASQYSVDATSKNNGGDLGWFPAGGLLIPEIDQAAFSLQPGQTSGVIATACCGYDIIQTLEIAPREVDPETRQRLIQNAIDTWVAGLRNGADVQQMITFTQ